MASYKGVDVKDSLRILLPHMPQIDEYREMLQSLQAVWDNLSLLGQLSGTTAETSQTRDAFTELTSDLLNNLAERTFAKRAQEMKSKAQVVIDILTRNLFERTADIGFITTDEVVRKFAANPEDKKNIQRRFHEYVSKYSVYEDVVLLSNGGEILARLIQDEHSTRIQEAWVGESISTSAAYVEYYGHTALFPNQARRLIYAYRVTSSGGDVLGVLALCFRFADEMERIFQELSNGENSTVMALLDSDGEVIASSDRWQIPVGAELNVNACNNHQLQFAGRAYLAFFCDSRGYQGYMGPGWKGLVMTPIDLAFDIQSDNIIDAVEPSLIASVLASGRVFPETLQAIPRKAEAIQGDLGRSIWNGMVQKSNSLKTTNADFSKILLWEISRIGMRIGDVFSSSIEKLQMTVISSLLADSHFFASLAIDIMDRNLYERANDCRWWALDPVICNLMSSSKTDERTNGIEKVLKYINGLYTVYDNLLVFDMLGVVTAVSNPNYSDLVGSRLEENWISEGLTLSNSQQYTVSDFVKTKLYADRPTYIYVAAIRTLDGSKVIGGIGISFDSEPQFSAMLSDSLPRDESGKPVEGSFAVFLDANSLVIGSSDPKYKVGEYLEVHPELFNSPPEGFSRLIEFDGQVTAVGIRRSSGYREYKGKSDSYQNEVTAMVFIPLGSHDSDLKKVKAGIDVSNRLSSAKTDIPKTEIATFFLGEHWFGIPVGSVREAIELNGYVRLANTPKQVFGAQVYGDISLPLYNVHAALGLDELSENNSKGQVVVLEGEDGKHIGVVVDRLGHVLEVPLSDIEDISNVYVGAAPLMASIVKTPSNDGGPMLLLLSKEIMVEQLSIY